MNSSFLTQKFIIPFFLTTLVVFKLHSQATENLANELRIKVESVNDPMGLSVQGENICCRGAIPQFYNARIFQPVWDAYLAAELIASIEDCRNEGLNPMDYHFEPLLNLQQKGALSPYEQTDFELLLTDGFLLLSSHLMSGKVDPQSIDSEWKVIRREGDPVKLLNDALAERNVRGKLEEIKPNFKAYRRLKEKLLSYRKIEEDGGWAVIPEGETIKLNMMSPRVEVLRKRLRSSGDLTPYTVEDLTLYDDVVQEAVTVFQKRNGLTPDGNLGKETVAALNVPVSERIDQIVLNMERCRWLPQDLGKKYIMVNLPAFELEVVKDGQVEMEMEVAVGKPYRQTPVFSSKMTYLVFNPYWTVPPTILAQDIIPAQTKNANYLDKLNIRVIAQDGSVVPASSIIWGEVNPKSFPYQLRQDPGPNNALGEVKFIFPNPYNIYMHDTNHRELFVKTDRALSSGCVRLSKPTDMANNLLLTQEGWNQERIKEVIKSTQNYSVILKEPVQVHLQYWTAFVDENGLLNFRKDIYLRDERVRKELKESRPQS